MRRKTGATLWGATALAAMTALTACGSSGKTASPGTTVGAQRVAVTLTAQGCDPAALTVEAGSISFAITNSSSSRSEFEVRTAKPSIVGESEGIPAGGTAQLDLDLDDGKYDLACGTGDVYENALVVGTGVSAEAATGTTVEGGEDIAAVVALYTTYTNDQLGELVTSTQALSDAVASGNIDQAKTTYAASRLPYERLEPIAELFPDLDGAMDAREDDYPDAVNDPTFTGWHRIEYLLYSKGDVAAAAPFATELAENAKKLRTEIAAITIDPGTMTNGAAGLIEEAAATKITGEEDRYSQLSLIDLDANVAGAKKIVELLTPLLEKADPALLTSINENFTAFEVKLGAYETGEDVFLPYDQLTEADRDKLKASLAALSEDLSKIPGTLNIEVK